MIAQTTLGRVTAHFDKESGPATGADTDGGYSERLWVPWWWWLPGLIAATLIGMEINRGVRQLPVWAPYPVLFAITAAILLWLGRIRVEVKKDADGVVELRAGVAHLPVSVIAKSAAIPASAKSAALGRQLDPAAYVLHRPWVGPMVLVVLDDPDDPTPYWLVSSRHPDRVLAALQS